MYRQSLLPYFTSFYRVLRLRKVYLLLPILVASILTINACQLQVLLLEDKKESTVSKLQSTDENSLKNQIEKQYPKLADPSISDWEKVNILRRWAYRNINVSSNSCLLEKIFYPDFYKKNAAELFNAFKQKTGGVWCGGSAFFLTKLYHYYGYESYILNMGNSKFLTHVVTLVKIRHHKQILLVIEDAYTNVTYTKHDETPIDFLELLNVLEKRNDSQVKTLQSNDGKRKFIFCPGDFLPLTLYGTPLSQVPCEKFTDGRTECQYSLTLDDVANRHPLSASTKKFLADSGYKRNLVYLAMFPIGINDGTNEKKELLRKARQIIRRF